MRGLGRLAVYRVFVCSSLGRPGRPSGRPSGRPWAGQRCSRCAPGSAGLPCYSTMYTSSRQLPSWSQPMARGSTIARLLGVLLAGFICATCMALYYLSHAHSEIHILRTELTQGKPLPLCCKSWQWRNRLLFCFPGSVVWDCTGTSHHTQAQQVAEMHLTKLQEQVSRAKWSGVCVTDMNLLTLYYQHVCKLTGQ